MKLIVSVMLSTFVFGHIAFAQDSAAEMWPREEYVAIYPELHCGFTQMVVCETSRPMCSGVVQVAQSMVVNFAENVVRYGSARIPIEVERATRYAGYVNGEVLFWFNGAGFEIRFNDVTLSYTGMNVSQTVEVETGVRQTMLGTCRQP